MFIDEEYDKSYRTKYTKKNNNTRSYDKQLKFIN